jgi:hypothetical protein
MHERNAPQTNPRKLSKYATILISRKQIFELTFLLTFCFPSTPCCRDPRKRPKMPAFCIIQVLCYITFTSWPENILDARQMSANGLNFSVCNGLEGNTSTRSTSISSMKPHMDYSLSSWTKITMPTLLPNSTECADSALLQSRTFLQS